MLSSRLNKVHIWLRLGFLGFYGCKTQASHAGSTECFSAEKVFDCTLFHIRSSKTFLGDLIFSSVGPTNGGEPRWTGRDEDKREDGGSECVGLLCDPPAPRPGGGKPPALLVLHLTDISEARMISPVCPLAVLHHLSLKAHLDRNEVSQIHK